MLSGMDASPKIILASSSPRRRELLASIGLDFRVVVPEVDEVPRPGESPYDFAVRAARDKAVWVHATLVKEETCGVVIGADTVVTLEGRIFGKPSGEADARAMLSLLSGKTHEVVTGLCVISSEGKTHALYVATQVTMNRLSVAEVAAYVATGEPMDKAGAYAIQGGAAYMVSRIEGSYTNVVGLPLAELHRLLKQQGAI